MALQEGIIEKAMPKLAYFDKVLQSESAYVTNETAV